MPFFCRKFDMGFFGGFCSWDFGEVLLEALGRAVQSRVKLTQGECEI